MITFDSISPWMVALLQEESLEKHTVSSKPLLQFSDSDLPENFVG